MAGGVGFVPAVPSVVTLIKKNSAESIAVPSDLILSAVNAFGGAPARFDSTPDDDEPAVEYAGHVGIGLGSGSRSVRPRFAPLLDSADSSPKRESVFRGNDFPQLFGPQRHEHDRVRLTRKLLEKMRIIVSIIVLVLTGAFGIRRLSTVVLPESESVSLSLRFVIVHLMRRMLLVTVRRTRHQHGIGHD